MSKTRRENLSSVASSWDSRELDWEGCIVGIRSDHRGRKACSSNRLEQSFMVLQNNRISPFQVDGRNQRVWRGIWLNWENFGEDGKGSGLQFDSLSSYQFGCLPTSNPAVARGLLLVQSIFIIPYCTFIAVSKQMLHIESRLSESHLKTLVPTHSFDSWLPLKDGGETEEEEKKMRRL